MPGSDNLTVLPSKADRRKVDDTLQKVKDAGFDEVVIIGFKNGKSYLNHSKIENINTLVGSIEDMKYRLLADTMRVGRDS